MTRADALGACFEAFAGYPLRASLAALGVTIGVATIITAFAIGEGARHTALSEIAGLGIDNVFVRASRNVEIDGYGRQRELAPQLSVTDGRALAALPGVNVVAAARAVQTSIDTGSASRMATYAGVSERWPQIVRSPPASGRWFSEIESREGRRVGVMGASLARSLFGDLPAIGRSVRAGGSWVRIVGVLPDVTSVGERAKSIPPLDTTNTLFVPLVAMDVQLGYGDSPDRVQHIALSIRTDHSVEGVSRAVDAVLKRRHRAIVWELVVPRALLQARVRAQRTFNVVLYAIGALALVISGVGIMNILLASVVERTHEIGVRRALGARRGDVLTQFALEAVLLSLVGGALGLPLGWFFASLVAWLAGWPIAVSGVSVALALTLAAALGVGSGVYPARVAADLEPAAALRAE